MVEVHWLHMWALTSVAILLGFAQGALVMRRYYIKKEEDREIEQMLRDLTRPPPPHRLTTDRIAP